MKRSSCHSMVLGWFLLLCTGCGNPARAVAPTMLVVAAPISSETSISIPPLATAQPTTTRSTPVVVASITVAPSAVPTATTLQRSTVAAQVVVAPTTAQLIATLLPPTALSGNGPGGCTLNAQSVSTLITPSGAALIPGASLNAIWQIRNDGTCVWGQGYQFVYVNGTQLSDTTVLNSMPTTPAGQNVSFQVAMGVPTTPGVYTSIWQLQGSNGVRFGWFPVEITVQSPTPTAIPTNTASTTPTLIPTETDTPSPTLTPSVTPTSVPTITPNPTATSVPIVIPSVTPTTSPTQTPSETHTSVPTNTPSPTAIRDQRWGGAWNCKRSSGEPCTAMLLTQAGSDVDGTWGTAGTLHGQISSDGQTLGGSWAYSPQNGTFVVALASDGQSWFGIVQPDNRFWCGWRAGQQMPAVCAGQPPS